MTPSATFLILVAPLLVACTDTHSNGANAAGAAEVGSAAHEQAIRTEINRWKEHIKGKDPVGIANMYADDGVLMPPNMPAATGRPAIQQAWQNMLRTPGFNLAIQPQSVEVARAGDVAIETGTYRFTAAPPAGPVSEDGKYLVVWKNVGGRWQAYRDMFNSDRPPAQ